MVQADFPKSVKHLLSAKLPLPKFILRRVLFRPREGQYLPWFFSSSVIIVGNVWKAIICTEISRS